MTKPRHQDQFEDARFAMSADTTARTLDISVTTLLQLVDEGSIPKPFPIPGHPRLVRWDPADVHKTVQEWKELANPGSTGTFNDVR